MGSSPFALALLTIISVARSKIFLFPRSIDSRHLAPIRQVVICVEGIEISIVAVRLPPGITEAGGSRLKRRRRLREKKTFIKKGEDWRAGSLRSLIRRATTLAFDRRARGHGRRRAAPALCACRGQRDAEENTEAVFLSNQHSYWARVLHLTVFLPECLQAQPSLLYTRLTARALPANLMSCLFFPSPFFFISLFILFSFIRTCTRDAVLCNATVEHVLAKRECIRVCTVAITERENGTDRR